MNEFPFKALKNEEIEIYNTRAHILLASAIFKANDLCVIEIVNLYY